MANEPRFPQVRLEGLADAQRRVAEEILKVSSGGLGGPYNMLLRSPDMTDRVLKLADYLRFKTSVPKRLNELAILIQARLWTAQYEWWAHYPLALKAGLSEAIAADLREGRRPAAMQEDEAVVYDFCVELCRNRAVSDASLARAKRFWASSRSSTSSPSPASTRWCRWCSTSPRRRSPTTARRRSRPSKNPLPL